MFNFLIILCISLLFTFLFTLGTLCIHHKQSKEVEGLKVGDNVNLGDLTGEITGVKEKSFVLKIEVPKMRVSKKK